MVRTVAPAASPSAVGKLTPGVAVGRPRPPLPGPRFKPGLTWLGAWAGVWAWTADLAAEVGELGERQRAAGLRGARGSIRSATDADRGK
ncbi:hypothetical protein GCM10022251_32000 [Phytohabitans flavus]